MRWLLILVACATLTVVGCDQRPIVINPQVVVVLKQGNGGAPAHSGNDESSIIHLPVCDLELCEKDEASCAAQALTRIRSHQSPVWQQFRDKPATIFTLSARGYYVDVVRKVTFQKVVSGWSEIGCVRGTNERSPASESRLRECIRFMPFWGVVANRGAITELAADIDFRRVCLRDQP